jgi:hypothetical protein
VARAAQLSDAAQAMAAKPGSVSQLATALAEKNLLPDACRLLAFALPKREAVWWACCCIRDAKAIGNAALALEAAEKWVANPQEDQRRAAYAAAEKVGAETPAGCAAFAAFFSGGSLAPPNVAEVPPPDHLTPGAAAGAVMLAAVAGEPAKAEERYKKFLAIGVDVASGKNKWRS